MTMSTGSDFPLMGPSWRPVLPPVRSRSGTCHPSSGGNPLAGHRQSAQVLAWHPTRRNWQRGQDGAVRIWNPETGTARAEVEPGGQAAWVENLRWSPDGKLLAASARRSGCDSGTALRRSSRNLPERSRPIRRPSPRWPGCRAGKGSCLPATAARGCGNWAARSPCAPFHMMGRCCRSR